MRVRRVSDREVEEEQGKAIQPNRYAAFLSSAKK